MIYVSKTLKYADNDLSSLNLVTRYDKNGDVIEVINAKRIDDTHPYILKRTYGEIECRVCKRIFKKNKSNQFTCMACIAKRPLAGLSGRRVPLKSEKP